MLGVHVGEALHGEVLPIAILLMLLYLSRQRLRLPGRRISLKHDVAISGLILSVDPGRPRTVVGLCKVAVRGPVSEAVEAWPRAKLLFPPGHGPVLLRVLVCVQGIIWNSLFLFIVLIAVNVVVVIAVVVVAGGVDGGGVTVLRPPT